MKTIKIIKLVSIMLLFIAASITTSCKKDNNGGGGSSTGKTGTFSIDGVSFNGKTTIQTFSNSNYSIVCQQDDPFNFVQVTFHNKAEAEAGGTFDVDYYNYADVSSGSVQVGIADIITSDPVGTHTISVSNKKITINNVKIKSTGGSGNTATINNATINF